MQKKISLSNKENGFSLIETAIIVMVMGLIIVPLFAYMNQTKVKEQALAEESNFERILAALSVYYQENGNFPSPANPATGVGEANFGIGSTSFDGPTKSGALPVVDLKLPPELSANKRGWKYIYAVSSDRKTPVFDIKYRHYNNTTSSFTNKDLIKSSFVIVDPGEDGKGAYTIYGKSGSPCGSAALDSENCDSDAVYLDSDRSTLYNINNADYYDDSIAYSLSKNESTFWNSVGGSASGAGTPDRLDIVTRKEGGVSLGSKSPGEASFASSMDAADIKNVKLRVSDGDMRINATSSGGGKLQIQDGDVFADQDVLGKGPMIKSNGETVSPIYYYRD